MRSKEDAKDYRYFPKPDLAPIVIDENWIASIKNNQPEFREEKMERYKREYKIPNYDIEILTESKKMADIFEETVAFGIEPKKVSNWLMVEVMRLLRQNGIEAEEAKFSPKHLADLIQLVEQKEISRTFGKEIFEKIFEEDVNPTNYVEQHGLKTVNDEEILKETIKDVIVSNYQSVADYKAGKTRAMGFLVGQVMKTMKGKADPKIVNQIVKELLDSIL